MSALLTGSKNIAIMGFSGSINHSVVNLLPQVAAELASEGFDDHDEIAVHVFTRDHSSSSTASLDSNPKVAIHFYPGYSMTDVTSEKKENTERMLVLFKTLRISRVFLCLPQTLSSGEMITVSNAFTDQILIPSRTVKTVVRISSYGLDYDTPKQGPLALAHKSGEEYMRSMGFEITSIRPTSFFSNFIKYDVLSIMEHGEFSSPLGYNATVNWIDNDDIAEVAARSLLDSNLDGKVLEITGPDCNSFTAEHLRETISEVIGKRITYNEIPLPDFSEDYKELWVYLRSNGFNAVTTTLKEVLRREGKRFRDMPILLRLAEQEQLTSQLQEREQLTLEHESLKEENESLNEQIEISEENQKTLEGLLNNASDAYQDSMDELDEIVEEFNKLNNLSK